MNVSADGGPSCSRLKLCWSSFRLGRFSRVSCVIYAGTVSKKIPYPPRITVLVNGRYAKPKRGPQSRLSAGYSERGSSSPALPQLGAYFRLAGSRKKIEPV